MHVIRHQAVGPQPKAALGGIDAEKVGVELVVVVVEEDLLAAVAPLSYVVRDSSIAIRAIRDIRIVVATRR